MAVITPENFKQTVQMLNVSLIKVMQLMKAPVFNGNSLFFTCHLKGSYQVLSFGKNFMILVWARAITFDEGTVIIYNMVTTLTV